MGNSDHFEIPDYYSRLFHDMAGWEELMPLGDSVYFPEHCYVVSPGDEIKYCYVVISGRLVSMEINNDGIEHIFNIFGPGSIFLESNAICGYKSAVYFRSETPVELLRIPVETVRTAIDESLTIRRFILEAMCSKYYSAMDQLRNIYNHNSSWNIYNMLCLLANSIGRPYFGEWIMIDMKLSQNLISSMLGINRVTVSKILKSLRDSGRILQVNNAYYCVNKNDVIIKTE